MKPTACAEYRSGDNTLAVPRGSALERQEAEEKGYLLGTFSELSLSEGVAKA